MAINHSFFNKPLMFSPLCEECGGWLPSHCTQPGESLSPQRRNGERDLGEGKRVKKG